MRNLLLKLIITISFGVLFAIHSLNGSGVQAFSSGPQPSETGAPGETDCTSCHSGGPTGGTLSITLPANYSPGQEITVTVTLAQQNRARYGFQLTAVDDSGKRAGDLISNDGRMQTQTNSVNGNQRQYINHTSSGNTPTTPGQASWTFIWKTPAESMGRVTFYFAGNAANGNGATSGDSIYKAQQSIQPATLSTLASVSAASFAISPLAANQIVAGFGTGLSTNVVEATTIPLPTELDGTEVRVKDASGMERPAGLFFVSPTQINYLIPASTARGSATIIVRRNGMDTAQGNATIDTIAPGMFSANANGKNAAAAVILRRRGGNDTFESVAERDPATNRFVPLQIDLGPEGDRVFLLAFGTGFRNISAQTSAMAAIGGTPATVLFAGGVQGLEGLDQANIEIPRSLIGRGLVNIAFTADGKEANIVEISIK